MEESVPTSVRLVPSAQESRPRWQILVVTLHPSQALHTTFPYLTAALSEHVDIVQARTREAFNHYLQTNVPVAVIFTDNEVIYPVTSAYGHLNGAFKKLHLYLMQKRTTVICACHWGRLFRPSHWTFFREMFEREWDHGGRYRITCFASQPCVTHLPVIVEGGAPIPYTPTATFAMVGQDGPVNELIYEFANGARSVEDNFLNGIVRLEKILGVDHLLNYKPPRTSPVAMGRYRNGQYICYVGDWKTGSIESSLEAGGDQSIDIILAMCRFAALRLTEPFLDPQGYVLHLFNIKKPLTVLERKPLWRTNAKYGFHRSRHEHGIHAERSSSKQPLRQSGSTESAVFKLWTDGSREARYDRQLRSPTANFVFERGYWAYRWDVGGIDDVILETMGLDVCRNPTCLPSLIIRFHRFTVLWKRGLLL